MSAPPWPIVWVVVGLLAALLVGWLLGVLAYRYGIKSVAELRRQTLAERVVEQQEAAAERDVAQRGEAERAAAGRDDGTPREG
jgi:high-affinity Fe2+/Pb2+ permease